MKKQKLFHELTKPQQMREVKQFVKKNVHMYTVDGNQLESLERITGHTYIRLIHKNTKCVIEKQWRHLKKNGVSTNQQETSQQPQTLYLELFQENATGFLCPKIGITDHEIVSYRFHGKNEHWTHLKKSPLRASRRLPKGQAQKNERRLKDFLRQSNNKYVGPNAGTFIWGGGKEELGRPLHQWSAKDLSRLFALFEDDGFDSL